MLTQDAVRYFGNQSAIARALDISAAAVSKWGEIVPLESALALEILSGRRLRCERTRYPNLARALDTAEAGAVEPRTA
jgi:DNA-binding transcriptional regulator YdaS (Cro superfamily)